MKLRDYQNECIETLDRKGSGRWLVQMATGLGKCFEKGTPILMYDGTIKSVEDIREGDFVMGWDSCPRKVKGLAHGQEMMYRIDRPKHNPYVVNESHILSLCITDLSNSRKHKGVCDCFGNRYGAGDICNIEVKDYLKCSNSFKHVAKGFCKEVEFDSQPIPVDAYFVGLWLGDGTSRALNITTEDDEIFDYIQDFASKNDMIVRKDESSNAGNASTYCLSSNYKRTTIREYFRKNLFENKHIPNEYLYNSKEVRLQLLAGLLDTDGYLNKDDRHTFEFCTKDANLQNQVAFLCRSLGFTAKCFVRHNNKYNKDFYYLSIFGRTELIPTKIARKKAVSSASAKNNLVHGIKVTPVGIGEYYGFELEGSDRMFLLGDCTVVHNTVTFANMKRQGRMLILSHREELVNQPLKYFDCSTGIEMADKKSNGEEVVSASVQSLIRRLGRFKGDEFDTIVVDEAHHAVAKSYRTILNHFKARQVVGFTATPNRGDKVRLNDVFDEIVFECNLRWGIENKYLSDIDCRRVDIGYDLTNVHTRRGDFAQDELAKEMEGTEKAIAEVYKNYAKGATLIFASSVKHAEAIAKKIKGAVVVTAQTNNRAEIVKDFTERKIPCIVNCMIFTEGTDLPLVETVIIARPTQSDALYAQMVGRGLRLCEGKEKLRLIDCVGVTGKRDLCTAPSLLGLDISVLDKNKRNKVEGDLLKLDEVIERLTDTPKVWIKSIESVRLWGEEQGYNLHDVNYCRMPDGSFICNLPKGRRITIPCPDVMGNVISQATGRSIPIQEAFDKTRKFLERNYNDSKNIWDSRSSRGWAREHASDKQIAFIKKNCKGYLDDINFSWLTKLEASQIISRISYENSKNP